MATWHWEAGLTLVYGFLEGGVRGCLERGVFQVGNNVFKPFWPSELVLTKAPGTQPFGQAEGKMLIDFERGEN